jgi:replicative DNA helicase
MPPTGRIPPQAIDVEQAVLGAMLIDRKAAAQAAGLLRPDVFYALKHQRIFTALAGLFGEGAAVDLLSATDALRSRGELEEAGGAYYLTELTARVGSASNVERHARILQEKAMLRRLIESGTRLVGAAYDPQADPFALADEAVAEAAALTSGAGSRLASPEDLPTLAAEPDTFVPTGLPSLDAAITGLMPGRVTVVAARPSHGKTAFALELSRRAATLGAQPADPFGDAVLYFSAEMTARAISKRLGAGGWNPAPRLYIDEAARPTTAHMMGRAASLAITKRVRFIVFDYLQYTGEKAESRRLAFDQALYGCHEIAKRLERPVLVLAQLNRQIEQRSTATDLAEPQLSDLKESGGIEEVAALVLMLHHHWTHWFQRGQAQEDEPDPGAFRVFARKNTHGPLGAVTLDFNRKTGRFTDPEESTNGRLLARSYTEPTNGVRLPF